MRHAPDEIHGVPDGVVAYRGSGAAVLVGNRMGGDNPGVDGNRVAAWRDEGVEDKGSHACEVGGEAMLPVPEVGTACLATDPEAGFDQT